MVPFLLFLTKVWLISQLLFPCSLFYMSLILLPIFYLLAVSLVFQDLQKGMTIGSGREVNGLYFLNISTSTPGQLFVAHHTSISPSAEETIWLWHRRLGHPSFHLIQHLFPSLLPSNSISLFQFDSCELDKHHRIHFSISSTKINAHFSIVYFDI